MADSDSFIPALHKPLALLPIARNRNALLYTIEKYPVTVLIGQTGSGKTTQLPQFLEQAGWCTSEKLIGITQARIVHMARAVCWLLTAAYRPLTAPASGRDDSSPTRGR